MKPLSVSELTSAIKSLLEPSFRAVAVQGEISNFKQQSSGHLYFTLKDASSQLSCALFRASATRLQRLPKEGDQVILQGEISLYAPRGQYQMIVRELEFQGAGELLLRLQKLKNELQGRGWFDPAHKKPLPRLPKRIGVVTSPTGAVIRDILNVLERRFAGFHLILNPVKVQGDGAALEIAQAISDFNRFDLADVLIVGRGGGSIEDLWAFNEEIVVKEIFESRIPIISAVGHETDVTLADFAADVRAPTPSAAAEIAIAEKASLLQFLSQASQTASRRVQDQIGQLRRRLFTLKKHPFLSSPATLLAEPSQKLDLLQTDLERTLKHKIGENQLRLASAQRLHRTLDPSFSLKQTKQRLEPYPARLKTALDTSLKARREKLLRLAHHLRSLNPENVLKKGYSILFSEKTGSVILSAESVEEGDPISARLSNGKLFATVRGKS